MSGQEEFRLGPVGAIRGGLECDGCGYTRPPGPQPCPTCGREREGLAGAPYPDGDISRYQWVLDQNISNLTGKFVLLALVHHHRPGGAIFPSQTRLAEMIGASERTVRDALRWLERHGWIGRSRRHLRGHRTSDSFTILQPEEALPANLAGGLPADLAG